MKISMIIGRGDNHISFFWKTVNNEHLVRFPDPLLSWGTWLVNILIIIIIVIRDWSTTTPAPTSPPPVIVLDPIMEEMMTMVNWTELEARSLYKKSLDHDENGQDYIGNNHRDILRRFWSRFGETEPQGLGMRNAFGSFEELEPTPAPYRWLINMMGEM